MVRNYYLRHAVLARLESFESYMSFVRVCVVEIRIWSADVVGQGG